MFCDRDQLITELLVNKYQSLLISNWDGMCKYVIESRKTYWTDWTEILNKPG